MSLEFIEIKIPKNVMKDYLEKILNRKVTIEAYERLGSGWHGTGYKIVYRLENESSGSKKTCILRTLRPEGFSHDFPSDRAASFLLQHQLSKHVPKHVTSIDVGGFTPRGDLVSIGNCTEFFQLVEFAEGKAYVEDLDRILKEEKLTELDKKRVLMLSDYLVKLHSEKFSSLDIPEKEKKAMANSIYMRHTRDCVGHGEMLYGVLDTYPNVGWTSDDEFVEIISKAALFRQRIRHLSHRLSRIHGDFHQYNILFSENDYDDFIVLDASRELWGEPADDVTCITLNYVCYALMQRGSFKGPFRELFGLFWENYLRKTKDFELLKVAPLFFAFRGVVIAHPVFYPDHSVETRRRIFEFIKNVLDEERFDYTKVDHYLGF